VGGSNIINRNLNRGRQQTILTTGENKQWFSLHQMVSIPRSTAAAAVAG
jgi:hypothetical protein